MDESRARVGGTWWRRISVGVLVAVLSLGGASLEVEHAEAQSTTCIRTGVKKSTWSFFGTPLYHHESEAWACRTGSRVASLGHHRNTIVKAPLAFLDWTSTSQNPGPTGMSSSWYWTQGCGSGGIDVRGLPLSVTKCHAFRFEYFHWNGVFGFQTRDEGW
jgi:hypothetical protein